MLDRESPGRGYRHVLTKRDLQEFIDIIPGWERFAIRLERIILAAPYDDCDGAYTFHHREETGVIYLYAWPEDLWITLPLTYFENHQRFFELTGVAFEKRKKDAVCRFTQPQARAFMLLHIFLHELGHHYDRTNQKHFGASKGEDYAESFANSRFSEIYPRYIKVFGDPTVGKQRDHSV